MKIILGGFLILLTLFLFCSLRLASLCDEEDENYFSKK